VTGARRIIGDRFEMGPLSGAGGMGRVYRAQDLADGGAVAVKIVAAAGPVAAERFAREAEALAGLSHPAIVRYVAHGETDDGDLYLVTEWLDGEDLGARLRRAGLTMAESLALGLRAATALGEAHRLGVVHRDVKPGNLWLVGGRPEEVKILDFGIARLRGHERTLTQAGAMIGTPGYMAPEQARGERRVDARADVFSLGCVLFKCLSGRLPFAGDDVMAVLLKLVLEEAPRLTELCPDAPSLLDDLVARMLAKAPEERPADGAAVARELSQIEPRAGGSAGPPSAAFGPALTTTERPVMCVVLADLRAPVALQATRDGRGPAGELRFELSAHGAEPFEMADGSLLLTVASAGAFTDQAARAARAALLLSARHPAAAIAVLAGRGERASRRPMGEVIDRGVELLRRTPGGAVRVDESVAGLVAAAFDLRGDEAGLLLHGERAAEGKRTLLGKPTPFVGREREMLTLTAIYDEVRAESAAHAVVVVAGAGMGKSRLRQELVRHLRAREGDVPAAATGRAASGVSEPPHRGREAGFELWLGRGDAFRKASPFGLLGPMIRGLAGVLDGEPEPARRRKLGARVGRHLGGADRDRVAVFLGEIAAVPFPDEALAELPAARRDPLLMGDQMRRAFEDFLAAECAAGPVLLALDDAHFADRPSISLIDGALRSLPDRPLLVLALGRPELDDAFPALFSGRPMTKLKLNALTRKAGERLVREVLGDAATPAACARIVELAQGDAFFLEELIRAVAEGLGERLPETVLAMVQQRLDGLAQEHRRVLRAASVFGSVFWPGGLSALLGGDERTPAILDALHELTRRELAHRQPLSRFPGEEELVFRQTLLREAAYAMLTDDDRRLGHRLAGEWLTRVGEIDAAVIADHFERAGEPGRALASYHRAAAQALAGNDLDEALLWCARALGSSPPDAAHEELGALHLVEAEALRWRDDLQRAAPAAAEAMRLLPRGSAAWFHAAGESAILAGRLGRDEGLAAVAAELCALWRPDPSPEQVMSTARAGAFLILRGDYARADQLLALVEPVEPALADPAARARIDQALASRALVRGDLGAHLGRTVAAVEHFSAAGDQRNACLSRITAGFAEATVGRFEAAARELREALAVASRMALPALAAYAKHTLGMVLAELGALDEAAALEAEAVEAFGHNGDERLAGGSRVYLARIRHLRGELDLAEREADAALAALAEVPPVRVVALAVRARVRLARSRPREALADAEEAFAVLFDLGGIEEGEALVRLAYAEALLAAGKPEDARAVLVEARDRLLERAARISDEATRAGFLSRVEENARTLALALHLGAAG
jgi:tetratricopeptide (TPR) repeat protein